MKSKIKKISHKEQSDYLKKIDLPAAGLWNPGYFMDMAQFNNFTRQQYEKLIDLYPNFRNLPRKEKQKINITRAFKSGEISYDEAISEFKTAGLEIPNLKAK